MFIFEFAQQQYMGLDVACSDFLNLPLASLIKDLSPILCFYYRDMVLFQNETVFFEGMVCPDLAILTSQHISKSLECSKKYIPPDSTDFLARINHLTKKENHEIGYTNAGKASTDNAILGGKTYLTTNQQPQEKPLFELLEYVLPYYLLPVDWLKEFAIRKGITANIALLEKSTSVSATKLETVRGNKLKNQHTRTDGDTYQILLKHYATKIETLEQDKTQLQNAINELQQQLATQTHKPNDTVTNPMQKKATAKLIGSLILKAFHMLTKEQGLKTHGLISAVEAEAGVSQAVAKAWIDLAIEELF